LLQKQTCTHENFKIVNLEVSQGSAKIWLQCQKCGTNILKMITLADVLNILFDGLMKTESYEIA
jgi:hypothetical protein